MKVLHLTPELPFSPGGNGGMTRQFHLLRRLAELGHEVHVVAPVATAQEPGVVLLRAAGVGLDAVRRPDGARQGVVAGLHRRPGLVLSGVVDPVFAWRMGFFWALMAPVAVRRVAEERPDVVLVEHDWAARWIHDLPRDLPAVLDLENVSWAYYRHRARESRGAAALALRAEAARFKHFDMRHLRRYQALAAVSEADRAELATVSDVPCGVVPNGVATDEFTPQPDPTGPPTVLFAGTMNYPPNATGIAWFVREVWPRVLSTRPDAELRIVGRDPPASVQRLAMNAPTITVTGAVDSMLPEYQRSTAVVVPLRAGGGSRLKVLEAFAAGRAIVTTTIGVEGIDAGPGVDMLRADRPADFAASVLELLEDADLRRRLAQSARRLIERKYDWRTAGDALADVLQGAAH